MVKCQTRKSCLFIQISSGISRAKLTLVLAREMRNPLINSFVMASVFPSTEKMWMLAFPIILMTCFSLWSVLIKILKNVWLFQSSFYDEPRNIFDEQQICIWCMVIYLKFLLKMRWTSAWVLLSKETKVIVHDVLKIL